MTKWWPFLRKDIPDDGPVPLPDPVMVERPENVLSDELQAMGYDDERPFGDDVIAPEPYQDTDNNSYIAPGPEQQPGEPVEEIRYEPVVDDALPGVEPAPQTRPGDPEIDPAISWLAVSGIGKSFGGRKVASDVSLMVRQGEAVGLLGPNGAGKTTVFYMIMGLLTSDTGRIELDGKDITHLPMYQRARLGIGYLPQEASIFRGLTVEANIRAVLEFVEPKRKRREEQLDALLEEFNITHIRKSPAIALSGGERRRVEIARALASRPSFMLLDEPFAGVDPIAIGDIRNLVHHLTQRGIGVLITDHNVRETLALIDRAYIIYSGSVLMEGNPNEIINSTEVRRLYLGDQFTL